MGIKVLDKKVWGQIAAGEVVEKPASIVKELVENSIDAKANNITIEIADGGTTLISVTDDGCGIEGDELELAFMPHATSKLTKIEDLQNLNSMGFRGEALASICAVSKVEITSKSDDDFIGHRMVLVGGDKQETQQIACNIGTMIKVTDLFYNTPARAKFLRKTKTEENDITSYVEKLMLSHPKINFKYIVDGKIVYNTANCSVLDIIYTIYGSEVSSNMIEVDYTSGNYKVTGYISKPTACKANRTYQTLFVNKRYCINSTISASISNAYENFLMKGKFPAYVLFLTMPTESVDVNVHPNKLEVKFENNQAIYMLFNTAITETLTNQTYIKDVLGDSEQEIKPQDVVFNSVLPNEGISFAETNNIQPQSSESYNTNFDLYSQKNELKFEQSTAPLEREIFVEEPKPKFEAKAVDEKLEQVKYDNLFSASRQIIGVAFKTFIIVQEQDVLYFIDQHAGHERLLFDKFNEELKNQKVQVQQLLVPFVLNVNDKESEYLESHLDELCSQGFEMSLFGKNSYRITSVPMLLNGVDLGEYFGEVLANINNRLKSPQEMSRHMIATMACKAAVKAGNKLSEGEINILLDELKKNNNTLLCPHGRPVVITFDKKQFEKMFKRIV